MASHLSQATSRDCLHNNIRVTPAKKITPAIPLFFVQRRQQLQAERARARQGNTSNNSTLSSEAEELKHEETAVCKTSPKIILTNLAEKPKRIIDSVSQVPHTEPLKSESNQSNYTQSTSQNLEEGNASNENIRLSRVETIDSTLEPTQGICLKPEVISSGQSRDSRVKSDSVETLCQQPHEKHHISLNEKIMVRANSESSKSSPAPSQSIEHLPPSDSHNKTLPGYYFTHQPNSVHSQYISIGYPPNGPSSSQGYHKGTNGNADASAEDSCGVSTDPPVPANYPTDFNLAEVYPPYNFAKPFRFHESQPSPHDRNNGKLINSSKPSTTQTSDKHENIEHSMKSQRQSTSDTNYRPFSPPGPIRQSHVPHLDMFDGLLEYLSSQFANPTFADYILKLRFTDNRTSRIQIPGHSLIFARSITLRDMMMAARSSIGGTAPKILLIESDDRFLCFDGLYMAMHRLYGNPLLDLGYMIPVGPEGHFQLHSANKCIERFDLALGYAAAGHLLKMDVIVNRGCEIASLTLHWTNLEKGLDFALDGGLEPGWKVYDWNPGIFRATYGPGVHIILVKVVDFICCNFPANFQLDTSVAEARFALRLPELPSRQQTILNPRLGHIKFGDYASEECNDIGTRLSPIVVLSRVLISLPWELLRCIFESANLSNNIESLARRHHILSSVIIEREKRRINVLTSQIPNSERHQNYQKWATVGWTEMVEPLRGGERYPKLTRTWTDFNLTES